MAKVTVRELKAAIKIIDEACCGSDSNYVWCMEKDMKQFNKIGHRLGAAIRVLKSTGIVNSVDGEGEGQRQTGYYIDKAKEVQLI
jgi:hypothetical protein